MALALDMANYVGYLLRKKQRCARVGKPFFKDIMFFGSSFANALYYIVCRAQKHSNRITGLRIKLNRQTCTCWKPLRFQPSELGFTSLSTGRCTSFHNMFRPTNHSCVPIGSRLPHRRTSKIVRESEPANSYK